jgi:hypothetical protein
LPNWNEVLKEVQTEAGKAPLSFQFMFWSVHLNTNLRITGTARGKDGREMEELIRVGLAGLADNIGNVTIAIFMTTGMCCIALAIIASELGRIATALELRKKDENQAGKKEGEPK